MCSSTLFVNCEQVAKDTVEKILYRTPFRSGRMSVICARLGSKGKVGVQRGRKTAGCPSFLPPPWARHIPAVRRRRIPPLRFSEKLPARQGRTRLRQFACPAQPMQKRSRPSGANPPAAVRVPRSADAEKEPPVRDEPACGSSCAPVSRRRKGAARQGRTRLRQFVCPGHLVPRKEKHRRIASTVLKVCTFTQIAAAYRHPYAPEPAGPVPDDRVR